MKYDYLVVGAGLFGACFAQQMNSLGKKCLVVEKRNHIGGMSYTENIDNIDVHKYGAHIFHTNDKRVWDYISQFADFNNFINSPMAVYKDNIYNLPFNMNTFAKIWGILTPEEAKKIINEQKNKYSVENPSNLEEQAINLVGKDIYEILIKGYSEKQWGKKCNELPAFIIKRLPVRFTYNNNYFNDRYQGIPVNGYTEMMTNMLKDIEVRLNCNYFDKKEYFDDIAEKIIFTGQIDKFFEFCYGPLEYRSLRFETEILDVDNFQGNAVINYTEVHIPYTRIIEHKHFNLKPNQTKTIVTKEYPQDWDPDKEAYYPINNDKNNSLYNQYNQLAKENSKIIFGGRLAEYKYYDMDQTIINALKAVEKEIATEKQ
ncbi:MAG: UDP-galactopyranose mutase [Candidatus Izemoplasmatales bacterium]|nr:UDP-galactopyranose mutase [Candidatus Izemoplasmatales bacterium]